MRQSDSTYRAERPASPKRRIIGWVLVSVGVLALVVGAIALRAAPRDFADSAADTSARPTRKTIYRGAPSPRPAEVPVAIQPPTAGALPLAGPPILNSTKPAVSTSAATPCDAAKPDSVGRGLSALRTFWLCYQGQPEPGPRWWFQSDSGWFERYPDGRRENYRVVNRVSMGGPAGHADDVVRGTIVTLADGGGLLEFFLPDRDAPTPYGRFVRFRYSDPTKESESGAWKFLAEIREIP